MKDTVGLGYWLFAFIIILVLCTMQGCGYALVKIPQPGERVSITTEQRVQSAFETAVENVEPQQVRYLRRNARE